MSGSRRKPGPLGPFVEGYRAWLLGRGYSPSGVIRSLIALGHLGRWMEREALAVDQLTAAAVSAFLAAYRSDRERLPTASIWPLLEYLRAEGAVPPEPPAVWSRRLSSWSASIASGCVASVGGAGDGPRQRAARSPVSQRARLCG